MHTGYSLSPYMIMIIFMIMIMIIILWEQHKIEYIHSWTQS